MWSRSSPRNSRTQFPPPFSTPKPLAKGPEYAFKLFKTASFHFNSSSNFLKKKLKSQKLFQQTRKSPPSSPFQPFPALSSPFQPFPALPIDQPFPLKASSYSSLEMTVRCFVSRLRFSSSRLAKTKLARIRNSSSTTLKDGEPDIKHVVGSEHGGYPNSKMVLNGKTHEMDDSHQRQ